MFDNEVSNQETIPPAPTPAETPQPKKKKRVFKTKYRQIPDSWDYDFTANLIKSIKDPTAQMLIATAYANGMRLSECMALKFNDISHTKHFFYIHQVVKKKGERSPKALKERAPPLSKDNEEWLWKIIEAYIQTNGKHPTQTDERPLFSFSRRTAQNRVDEYLKYNFHALRKLRVRHLIRRWDYDELRLKAFFALSNQGLINWAHTYGNLNASMLEAHWETIKNRESKKPEPVKEQPKTDQEVDIFG